MAARTIPETSAQGSIRSAGGDGAGTPKAATQYIFFFGAGKADGNKDMKSDLGGKGAGLAEMTNAGVPVPPGFTITTDVCRYYYGNKQKLPKELEPQQKAAMDKLQKIMAKGFGDPENPLLVSVRSGAKFSMPGMMDTILNLGINDRVVEGLARLTTNPRFAWDAYRRFIAMYGNVVGGIDKGAFEHILETQKQKRSVKLDTDLNVKDLQEIVGKFKELFQSKIGQPFPQDPWKQVEGARNAVFQSWNNPRAIYYRKQNKISDDLGTAVTVQSMVFGNMGDDSGTGVAFTRDPNTGEKVLYGEYLTNAQGEDVVAGIRTPRPISQLAKDLPAAYDEFLRIAERLERHYRDVQDLEFTIERGKLYMLQTRAAKRTGPALCIAGTIRPAKTLPPG